MLYRLTGWVVRHPLCVVDVAAAAVTGFIAIAYPSQMLVFMVFVVFYITTRMSTKRPIRKKEEDRAG